MHASIDKKVHPLFAPVGKTQLLPDKRVTKPRINSIHDTIKDTNRDIDQLDKAKRFCLVLLFPIMVLLSRYPSMARNITHNICGEYISSIVDTVASPIFGIVNCEEI
jgi:hypothetical protein